MIDLSSRKALVTGGAVGIGRGIALALAQAGADVALTYHSHEGEAVADEIRALGRQATALPLDATDSDQVSRVVDQAAAALDGRFDILVNNAGGILGRIPIAGMTDTHWHSVLAVNLSSTFFCTRAAIPHLPDGGRVVNISSNAARTGGGQGAAAYAAAKAGVHGLTRGLAKELGPRGITVNAIAPGFILDTPFHPTFTPEAGQRAMIEASPLKRAGYPRDVAGAVLYLVSDDAGFVSGAVIDLNGATSFN